MVRADLLSTRCGGLAYSRNHGEYDFTRMMLMLPRLRHCLGLPAMVALLVVLFLLGGSIVGTCLLALWFMVYTFCMASKLEGENTLAPLPS
jgi:hypothetical protein